MSIDRRNLALRVGLAAVAIPLVLWTVLRGGLPLALFAAALMILGAWEWVRICGLDRMAGLAALTYAGPIALAAALVVGDGAFWAPTAVALVLLAFVLGLAGPWPETGAIRSVGASVLGVFYIGLFGLMIPIGAGYRVGGLPEGGRVIATVLAIVWISDTFAYFGGSWFGRHRLAPRVSPKKSWEGAVSGFLGAILGAFLGAWLFRVHALGAIEIAAIGATVGVIGQIGDLGESMIKRDAGVKDSSALLPGHGGVLDRFDSFLFALPVVWGWMVVRPLVMGT